MDFLTLQAPNPGPLTLEGTNTYVVEGTVVDPGSNHKRHLEAILAAAGRVERIVLTHRHLDQLPSWPPVPLRVPVAPFRA